MAPLYPEKSILGGSGTGKFRITVAPPTTTSQEHPHVHTHAGTAGEPAPLARPGHGRPRPAHGRARRDHREHRAALRPGGARFSDNDRQWVVTAYALAFGSLLLLGGRLADMFGRRRMFLIGLVGFAVASALGGAAQTFELLVGARALQGAFAAVLAPAALSVLTTTFTIPKERARAFGVFGAIAGMGGAIGLLLGGYLTENFDWRWNLYVNVVIAASRSSPAPCCCPAPTPGTTPASTCPA